MEGRKKGCLPFSKGALSLDFSLSLFFFCCGFLGYVPCFAGLTFPSQKKREKTQIIFGFIEVEGKENERENRPDRKEGEGEEGEVSPRQEGMGARTGLRRLAGHTIIRKLAG